MHHDHGSPGCTAPLPVAEGAPRYGDAFFLQVALGRGIDGRTGDRVNSDQGASFGDGGRAGLVYPIYVCPHLEITELRRQSLVNILIIYNTNCGYTFCFQ